MRVVSFNLRGNNTAAAPASAPETDEEVGMKLAGRSRLQGSSHPILSKRFNVGVHIWYYTATATVD